MKPKECKEHLKKKKKIIIIKKKIDAKHVQKRQNIARQSRAERS